MSWFLIAIIAYFFIGLGNTLDKLVVSKFSSTPRVYAFNVGIMQFIACLVLLPFGFTWPGMAAFTVNFLSGAAFVAAIFCFYSALKNSEASSAIPTVDSLGAVFTIFLAILFLGEQLSINNFFAFIFILAGVVLISIKPIGFIERIKNRIKNSNKKKALLWIILAGFLFASSNVLAKYTYNTQSFNTAFILSRFGGFLFSLLFLLMPKFLKELKENFSSKNASVNTKAELIAQFFGGAGFFLQNFAFSLGSVGIISAMQGLKYAFLFIFIFLLGKKFKATKEEWNGKILIKKIGAVILIIMGMIILNL